MEHPLRFGLKHYGQDATIEDLRAIWHIADEGAFDHVWCFDHYASTGAQGPDKPVFEGWALQAAMAESTRRVRIGCMVTGNTYRPPWMLAKLAVTVDHLSGGRLEFGIGAAWAEIEHQMFLIPGLDERVGRLSESLKIMKSLWTNERTTFEGRYYTVRDGIANPKPVQKPNPPIWIGAAGDQMLRLTARHADVWSIGGSARGRPAEAIAKLHEACVQVGRDPGSIRLSCPYRWDGADRGALREGCARAIDDGFTEIIIYLPPGNSVHLAEAAAEVLPELRKLRRS
jgi:alkanesulfonate monooxygenase SsuD/methylene tetrahydromethanopterin reductase-like flavin-dependent oxidoreductase (luciferase family)